MTSATTAGRDATPPDESGGIVRRVSIDRGLLTLRYHCWLRCRHARGSGATAAVQ